MTNSIIHTNELNSSNMIKSLLSAVLWVGALLHFGTPSLYAKGKDIINGHEAVDLGLSVKWATCNIGADTPENPGDYFSWGEPLAKEKFDGKYKKPKQRDIRQSEYDAAHIQWGEGWRMPSRKEFMELKNQCSWKWTKKGKVTGFKITGPSGNSIFLPSTGPSRVFLHYHGDGSKCINPLEPIKGNSGFYWTSQCIGNGGTNGEPGNPFFFHFPHEYMGFMADEYPEARMAIRPVIDIPEDQQEARKNMKLKQIKKKQPFVDETNAVDLGLSVKWAKHFIGRGLDEVERPGKLFHWGDYCPIQDKDHTTFCIYLESSFYSYEDLKKKLECENDNTHRINNMAGSRYDMATDNWGGRWRLPTDAETRELFEKCQWELIFGKEEHSGKVIGAKATGPNGNFITFYYNRDFCGPQPDCIHFWTSADHSCGRFYLSSGSKGSISGGSEKEGVLVRPVLDNDNFEGYDYETEF